MARVLVLIKDEEEKSAMRRLFEGLGSRVTYADAQPMLISAMKSARFDLLIVDEALLEREASSTFKSLQPTASIWLMTDELSPPALSRQADFLLLKPVDARIIPHVLSRVEAREAVKR